MKIIELSGNNRGIYTTVDDNQYEYLNRWKWRLMGGNNKKYAARSLTRYINGKKTNKTLYMHHVILNITKGYQCDHINGNSLDNQADNLRIVTPSGNQQNRGKNKNNSSGYKNIVKTYYGAWYGRFMYQRKRYYTSVYRNIEQAILSLKKLKVKTIL